MAWLLSDLTSITGGANAVPGDPVGLILDISKMGGKSAAAYMAANGITDPNACPGTHFRQTTSGARPILARFPKSGVRNRFVWTEEQAIAAWSEAKAQPDPGTNNRSWQSNVAIAPDGTMTADKLVASNTNSLQRVYRVIYGTAASVTRFTWSCYAKAAEYHKFRLRSSSFTSSVVFNLLDGVIEGEPAANTVATMEAVGNGWYRCRITQNVASPLVPWIQLFSNTGAETFVGNNADGLYIWGTQFEDGEELTPYQRVSNAYDVVEAPYAHCYALVGDGLSKCMVSDAITPDSDKVTAFAAVRKLSDTTTGMVLEASANAGANSAIYLSASNTGVALYGMLSRGTAVASAFSSGTYPAPHSAILTGIGDIANDICRTRINGLQVASSVADQGSGNYGTHPLFLLARNQSSLFFNGYWFGGAIRWSAMPDADRAFVERLLAKNTMQVTL